MAAFLASLARDDLAGAGIGTLPADFAFDICPVRTERNRQPTGSTDSEVRVL